MYLLGSYTTDIQLLTTKGLIDADDFAKRAGSIAMPVDTKKNVFEIN